MTINKSILAYRLFAAASLTTIFAAAPIALDVRARCGRRRIQGIGGVRQAGDRGGDDSGGNSARLWPRRQTCGHDDRGGE